MKNVLFATTALVSVAGVAFADGHEGVALSGSAEMGITYLDDGTDENVEFHNDIDVTFTLSGSTPTGLTFGASIDLDEADGGAVIESSNSVFIEGSFGTLTMGDTDGAYDRALANIANGGLNDEADLASGTSGFDGFSDGEVLRYDYTVAGLSLSASLELEEDGVVDADLGTYNIDNIYGVGVAYDAAFGGVDIGVGLGAQFTSTEGTSALGDGDHVVYGASLEFGIAGIDITAVAEIFDFPSSATIEDGEIFGISGEYTSGAIGVGVGYERSDFGTEIDIFQAFATYDLGGGAEIVAAVGYIDDGTTEATTAGFGIGLSF